MHSIAFLGLLSTLGLGCSVIANPDPGRLGGEERVDSGTPTLDSGMSGTDSGMSGTDSGTTGTDSGMTGTDSGPLPECPAPDRCEGETLFYCDGATLLMRRCTNGCADGACLPEPTEDYQPSNLGPSAWDYTAPDVSFDDQLVNFDTSLCAAMSAPSSVLPLDGDSSACLLTVNNFRLGPRGALRVTGSRPLILLARGSVIIEGVIDVGARGDEPGPGGYAGGTPGGGGDRDGDGRFAGSGGSFMSGARGGGGGGGHCSVGGTGGNVRGFMGGTISVGGAGGSAMIVDDLQPITGGAGGGAGAGDNDFSGNNRGGRGGAGGGAIQISARESMRVRGTIFAGGGGGRGGLDGGVASSGGGGGGGGAGGAILLEAPEMELSGFIVAPGGGGGAGGTNRDGGDGEDGNDGEGEAASGEPGNPGGVGAGTARDGADAPRAESDGGGGGGGGNGCILLRGDNIDASEAGILPSFPRTTSQLGLR